MVNMPRPNYLRPVAGIKFEMSSFVHKIVKFLFKTLSMFYCE